MKDGRTYLKVKIKNLADEARTIRREEQKVHGMEKWTLQHHRKTVVRSEARRSLIAYQIIRGRDWQSSCSHDRAIREGLDWPSIERMVKKYGSEETVNALPQTREQYHDPSVWRRQENEGRENTRSNAA